MFRDDKVTITRENYTLIQGEAIYTEPEIVARNVPCHLSIGFNNTVKINNTPYLVSDFTLFLNPNQKFTVKENDTLTVTTSKNENFKLYAGQIKLYGLGIQIKCRQEKIIES